MSFHNHRQFTNALERIDQTVLPNLSRLLDGVLDSAALARPGVDGLYYADALRHSAAQLMQLTELVGAVAQRPMTRAFFFGATVPPETTTTAPSGASTFPESKAASATAPPG